MKTANLNHLELTEFTGKSDMNQHCYATFPLFGAHGTEYSATVYFELDPGDILGKHTDSAEELLLILDGEVEARIGNETGVLSKGEMAQVPKLVPHDITNIGPSRARILGFFGGANQIIATFEQPWLPTESNVVDTSKLTG